MKTAAPEEVDQQFFLTFWPGWPGPKVGRLAALKAFRKAIANGAGVDDLMAALANQKGLKAALKASGIWTPEWPHAATWLNGERWNDEVRTDQHGPPPNGTHCRHGNKWYRCCDPDSNMPEQRSLKDTVLLEPGEAIPGVLTLEQVIELERKREAARRAK